jgi:carbamoyl-phosphate synthase large subunit
MAADKNIKKVMVIGSGPISIGQAAEFDYAGTQACRALKEDGLEVVLVNSNPATIMTDERTADRVYIEPLTVEALEKIIEKERPDSLLPTLGGQTGLNLSIELWERGILDTYSVSLIGTDVNTIKTSEDRELFKKRMEEIGEPVADSLIATSIEEAVEFSKKAGFPLVVRPAFTLGGTGGGVADNVEKLIEITERGLNYSIACQVLIEKSLLGWKEIEYEVMRDKNDNCITICNMENLDPVGVHTGDSIVVVPSQTLTDKEYQLLRSASIKIIRSLGIKGGCNIQFALDPDSMNYYVIEVNPRVSRSSALASKAAGYPIARMAAKIAIGYTLDEIKNPITASTTACFEPTLDYVVIKMPRWPFDKFKTADRSLSTQMKATGEVMTIDRSFEGALMKAVRSLELGTVGLYFKNIHKKSTEELIEKISHANDMRLWALAEALRRGIAVEELSRISGINIWFVWKIKSIVDMEKTLAQKSTSLDEDTLAKAKLMGYSDREIAVLTGKTENDIKMLRKRYGIIPVCKTVDTCSAEFEASTSYYYSTYGQEDEVEAYNEKNVIILGSGSIRIGQGIEFDYCAVHSALAVKEMGYKSIIINNNPETVSTDFDISDRLYFEPLYFEDVMNIVEKEDSLGIIAQFGGQTALNTVKELSKCGVRILGTDFNAIDIAEDRKRFDYLLSELKILRPKGFSAISIADALNKAEEIGFPVLVRPSYVIGGQSMRLINSIESLEQYMKGIYISEDKPLLIDHYIEGIEAEVDALCDGEAIYIPGIMEHIERTGVHSGDSMSVFPSYTLNSVQKEKIIEITEKIALALNVKGLINIQFAVQGENVYVIEANPRASRTVPIISKVTGVPMVEIATRISLGGNLREMGYNIKYSEVKGMYAVKAPYFSFGKIPELDNILGPEMKSTGEVLGLDEDFETALCKAFRAAGFNLKDGGRVLVAVSQSEMEKWKRVIKDIEGMGYDIVILQGAQPYKGNSLLESIRHGSFSFVISSGSEFSDIRRASINGRTDCFTAVDTVRAMLRCVKYLRTKRSISVRALQDYERMQR